MGLVTICDVCESDWLVDSLVFIDELDMNICPNCANDLVDCVVSNISRLRWNKLKQEFLDAAS